MATQQAKPIGKPDYEPAPIEGYGAAGGSWLLNGFVAMELGLPGLHGTAASLSVQPMRGANASSPAHAARPRNALRPGVVPRC
jgi:hypothetical protein